MIFSKHKKVYLKHYNIIISMTICSRYVYTVPINIQLLAPQENGPVVVALVIG